MTPTEFTATISYLGLFYTAQCLEVDISREGSTQQEAVQNLADELAFRLRIPKASVTLPFGFMPEIAVVPSQAALSAAQAKRDRKAERNKLKFKNGSEIITSPSQPEDVAKSYRRPGQRVPLHQRCSPEDEMP
jgi:hypothetical protein